MVSQAEVIRDSLFNQWNLTGDINKITTDSNKEIVRFFDREQVNGNEWPKAVTVVKINDVAEENIIEHPRFSEVSDHYIIACRWRVTDVDPAVYSTALNNVEAMGGEVYRILRLTYSPSSETGEFFTSNAFWSKKDHQDGAQIELVRELSFTLTKIISEEPTVFTGYGGVLTFDFAASNNMDSDPGANYIYTESNQVRLTEGFETLPYLTKDKTLNTNGGVPALKRGIFRGMFNANVFAKKADINGTADKLNKIYQVQANGQHIEAVFLHANNSLETPTPSVLTSQSFVKVTNMEKLTDNEQLVSFEVTGDLIKPSVYTAP